MKQPGLDGRHRDQNGGIRRKNGNTRVGTLRKEYGEDFLPNYRADTHLDTVRERERVDSLNDLLKLKR